MTTLTPSRRYRRLGFLVFLAAAAFGQDFKFTSTSDYVLLDVSVKNSKGGYATGLAKDSFHVFEGGKPQTISHFSREDAPVTVGLVIDTSGSMRPKYRQVVVAALAFIQASNPKDEIFVVNFNDNVVQGLPPELPFSDDIDKLSAALSQAKPEGRTALYDAVALALTHLEKGKCDKKTLLVISDGGDNHSSHTFDEVKRLVEASRATIYTIGLFDLDDQDRNPGVLHQLSSVSGGESFLPKDVSESLGICRQVARDIRARYTIGYVPQGSEAHGAVRKIKVGASQADGEKLVVRTRTAYLIP